MNNILLKVSYDGTNYSGFQRQKNALTVQEVLEKSLSKLYRQEIKILASSRTDAGVHAISQMVSFKINNNNIPINNIPQVINTFLPVDVVVLEAYLKDDDFHPRYHTKEKTYEYKILNSDFPNPCLRNYVYYHRKKLNVDKMQEAAYYFLGTHDFIAFSSLGGSVKTSIRTIYELNVEKTDDIITIKVRGDGFLYNMVRIIAGTLLFVGNGKIAPSDIRNIILSKNRKLAGKTLKACGLTLLNVKY